MINLNFIEKIFNPNKFIYVYTNTQEVIIWNDPKNIKIILVSDEEFYKTEKFYTTEVLQTFRYKPLIKRKNCLVLQYKITNTYKTIYIKHSYINFFYRNRELKYLLND